MIEKFVNDDSAYLRWVEANTDGFVANVPRQSPSPSQPIVLHRASCKHVTSPARTNYTTNAYCKVCSLNEDELAGWANQQGKVKTCGHCKPGIAYVDTNASAMASGSQTGSTAKSVKPQVKPPVAKENVPILVSPTARYSGQMWTRGEILTQVDVLQPRLASWEKNSDQAQIALQDYLDDLMNAIGPLPEDSAGLYLHMDIDVEVPKHLEQHYDLENYLTPLFGGKRLKPGLFRLVSATKRVGGGSYLEVGRVMPRASDAIADERGWESFAGATDLVSDLSRVKAGLRNAFIEAHVKKLPDGPVQARIAWQCEANCASRWSEWWKPIGDAMGPVLGEPKLNPFDLADDRIVALEFHLDPSMRESKKLQLGLWWRSQ